MHLWWFWDICKSILLWPIFCGFFFKGFIKDVFLSSYEKSYTFFFFFFFVWHHTLNQHIHKSDTMHPTRITHFNIMILIPLCENCKLCTYYITYYEFSYFRLAPIYPTAMVYKFPKNKKSNTRTRWVCYVKNPIPVQHWSEPTTPKL
jgi:hypothetical protein